jgi:hypothetical protein
MYGLAYVLIPQQFASLQAELDRTLAPFMRGGEDRFECSKLAFDDATEGLQRLQLTRVRWNSDGSIAWRDGDAAAAYDLRLDRLKEHLTACRLDDFEGTLAEIEPDFDLFVRRFTRYGERDPTTSRYGRWLNPIGNWDWWELGGCFNGVITGDRRPAGSRQVISSGPSAGRTIFENLAEALGADDNDERAEIEVNVELVESLQQAAERDDPHWLPTAMVLPIGTCADQDRWLDHVEWHEIRAGTRTVLQAPIDADFATLVRAAYAQFAEYAAAGVAYHF